LTHYALRWAAAGGTAPAVALLVHPHPLPIHPLRACSPQLGM